MHESEYLQPVELQTLVEEQEVGKGGHDIKGKVSRKVVVSNLFEVLVSHGDLDEAEANFNSVDQVNCKLDVDQVLLVRRYALVLSTNTECSLLCSWFYAFWEDT